MEVCRRRCCKGSSGGVKGQVPDEGSGSEMRGHGGGVRGHSSELVQERRYVW